MRNLLKDMSRIGKQPIRIPEKVEVRIEDNQIFIKGPKGELTKSTPLQIKVVLVDAEQGKEIQISPALKTKKTPALWGLFRAVIFNMVAGVTEGFEKKLEIQGIGYRAAVQNNKLVLNLDLSHPIELEAPQGIEFKTEKNIIIVSGIDKQMVGQIAAKIRNFKKAEPYKGTGIKYFGEIIRRKAGKKAAGAQ